MQKENNPCIFVFPLKVLTETGVTLPFLSMFGEQMRDVDAKLIKKAVNDYMKIYRVINKECEKPFTLIFTNVVLPLRKIP